MWIPYCGAAPIPAELMGRWNFDPLVIGLLLAESVVGWRIRSMPGFRPGAFMAAIGVLALLFVSPFCALTSALFSARTVHHLALTAIVAPMLAAALPTFRTAGGVMLWTLLHGATFWVWHAPAAYSAALSSNAIYWLMQVSLLLTALALWRAIRAAPVSAAIGALLTTMVQMGLLGALLTFAGAAIYPPHYAATIAWGFSPLEDQQLAGLIMWAPGAGLYLAAALSLLSRWFARERREALAT